MNKKIELLNILRKSHNLPPLTNEDFMKEIEHLTPEQKKLLDKALLKGMKGMFNDLADPNEDSVALLKKYREED